MVNETAQSWGFFHLGQFAADYSKLFGELPSQTLK
jgi:AraC family ethanolamine operon transcriptional activator